MSGSEFSDSQQLEADLRAIVVAVGEAERSRGQIRNCSYGQGPDHSYRLHLPTGYDDAAMSISQKYGARVQIVVEDWIVSTRPAADAHDAFAAWLVANGRDRGEFSADEIRIDIGRATYGDFGQYWIRRSALDRSK